MDEVWSCVGCKGFFLGGYGVRASGRMCQRCDNRLSPTTSLAVNDRCRHVDRLSGPFSELIVIDVSGDRVEVQPLGAPERRRWEHVADLMKS